MAATWRKYKHFLSFLALVFLFTKIVLGENHSANELLRTNIEEKDERIAVDNIYASETNGFAARRKRETIDDEGWDSCSPYPCKNDGLCRKRRGHSKYYCECSVHFSGKLCEKKMPPCKSLTDCAKIGDCVKAPEKTVLCICERGEGGELCNLKAEWTGGKGEKGSESESDLELIEEALSPETKHNMVLIFAMVGSVLALVFVCLCLHCCRANAKKVKLRDKYKEKLQEGVVPNDVPPDLLDVSNALFMSMFCCGSKSKLLKDDDDTEKDSKSKKDKDLNKTSNSLVGRYRQPTGRSHMRRRTGGYYIDSRTKQQYPELIDSFGSYETMSDFNANNSMDVHPDNPRPLVKRHSKAQFISNNKIKNKMNTKTIPGIPNKHHSYLPRKIIKGKPISPSAYHYPKSKYVSRFVRPSADGHLKGNYRQYEPELESFSEDPDLYTSDTDTDSSSSEEELYHRDTYRYTRPRVSRNVNRNSNSNGTPNSETRSNEDPLLPDRYLRYTQPGPSMLSPDAKRNFCTNNSLTLDDANLPSNLKFTSTHESAKENQSSGDDHGNDSRMENITNCTAIYRDQHILKQLVPDDIVLRHENYFDEFSNEKRSEMGELQPSMDKNYSVIVQQSDDDLNNYGVWGMRVELVDEKGSASTRTGNAKVSNCGITDLNRNDNTQITRDISTDANHLDESSECADVSNTDKSDSSTKTPDAHYIKCFEEDGKTLYYVSEGPIAADQIDVDEDIKVIPDGKGSVTVVNKTET